MIANESQVGTARLVEAPFGRCGVADWVDWVDRVDWAGTGAVSETDDCGTKGEMVG